MTHNDNMANTTTLTATGNSLGGTVSGISTVVFDPSTALATSASEFGASYTAINEATFNSGAFAGDSSGAPKNNTMAMVMNLTNRALFGPVGGADAGDLAQPGLPSVKVTGTMTATSGTTDSDYVRVHLKAGETIILDIDRGIDGGGNASSVDTRLYFYDSAGTQLASNNSASSAALGGGGSTSTSDPFLTYTVGVEGDYYVRVRHESNATASDAGGDYDLWISIDPQIVPTTAPVGFDYTLTDAGETDSTRVDIYGVTGSIITGGAADEILLGGNTADTLFGNAGRDVLLGQSGGDALYGGEGADRLEGGTDADTLSGGAGSDVLLGGAGNDALSGGLGADIFRWELADAGASTVDTITDFDTTTGSDQLDLRDLLQGEIGSGVGNNLENYLHFEYSGSNTTVHISSSGGFAGGYAPGAEDQTILISGVNLIGSFTTDQQVIQDLLNRGKLITD